EGGVRRSPWVDRRTPPSSSAPRARLRLSRANLEVPPLSLPLRGDGRPFPAVIAISDRACRGDCDIPLTPFHRHPRVPRGRCPAESGQASVAFGAFSPANA